MFGGVVVCTDFGLGVHRPDRLETHRALQRCGAQFHRNFDGAAQAARVAALPPHHKDPFDRLLVAQALSLPARLLTADSLLKPYSDLVYLIKPV